MDANNSVHQRSSRAAQLAKPRTPVSAKAVGEFSGTNPMSKVPVAVSKPLSVTPRLAPASSKGSILKEAASKLQSTIAGATRLFSQVVLGARNDGESHLDAVQCLKTPEDTLVPIAPDTDKTSKSVLKMIRNAAVSLVSRSTREFSLKQPLGKTTAPVTQRFGQVLQRADGSFEIDSGCRTPSQEHDKYSLGKGRDAEVHVSNLGHLQMSDGVLVRSGRATSPAKVLEVLVHGAIASGTPDGGSFRGELCSFMDAGGFKSVKENFMDLKSRFGGKRIDHEARFLPEVRKAIDDLFSTGPTLNVRVIGTDGQPRIVTLEKPTFVHLPYSKSAGLAGGGITRRDGSFHISALGTARADNAPVFRQYLSELGTKWAALPSNDPRRECGAMIRRTLDRSPKLDRKTCEEVIQRLDSMHGKLSPRASMALDAIRLTLLGSTQGGEGFSNSTDGVRERVLHRALRAELGITPMVQCKSGQDRTGTEVAVQAACDQFEQIHGFPFDPRTMSHTALGTPERPGFAVLFTKAADALCADANALTRDKDAFKAKAHPFFKSTYLTDPSVRKQYGMSESSPLRIRHKGPEAVWQAAKGIFGEDVSSISSADDRSVASVDVLEHVVKSLPHVVREFEI